MVRQIESQDLLNNGFIKVGSKSYCEYWKKGGEIVTIYPKEYFRNNPVFEEYDRGYEVALKQIKRNLEHTCKGMWSVEMCYDGSPNNAEDLDRYEGESECYSFLLEELNLDKI